LRIRIKDELIALNLLVLVLILVIIFSPSNILRIILGVPFLVFFPGYTLTSALFPRKEEIASIERVALSFGLSVGVVPLIGLILNYTSPGIRLEPVLYSVAIFIFITSVIVWLRRRRLAEPDRFNIGFSLTIPSLTSSTRDRVLSIILVITVVGALGTVGYIFAVPKMEESFTEFYILGPDGKVQDYPGELKVKEEGRVIVGIINHEHETVTYRVEVRIDGAKNNDVARIVLGDGEKWEKPVSFVPQVARQNQKVAFFLFKEWQGQVYLTAFIWVNVKE